LARGVKAKGDLRLNGREYGKREMKTFSGYVLESDVVNGMLTVGETLWYTCKLRTSEELRELVLSLLNLVLLTFTKGRGKKNFRRTGDDGFVSH
jgi:ABC-type multidrug transport system ATPase subunit